MGAHNKISVIITALNDEKCLYATLEDLFLHHAPDEVIVVDGGSSDRTVEIASEWTRVLRGDKSLARQLNRGACEASGDIYLFLRADTQLPQGGLLKVKAAVLEGAGFGTFRVKFVKRAWRDWAFALYDRLQCLSYGNRGLFVHRDLFQRSGGFREDMPFESVDFYKRLRNFSRPVVIHDPVIATIKKRPKGKSGFYAWLHVLLAALYYVGFDVTSLKQKL